MGLFSELLLCGMQDIFLSTKRSFTYYKRPDIQETTRKKLLKIYKDFYISDSVFCCVKYRNKTYHQMLYYTIQNETIDVHNIEHRQIKKDVIDVLKQNTYCRYLIKDLNNIVFQYLYAIKF